MCVAVSSTVISLLSWVGLLSVLAGNIHSALQFLGRDDVTKKLTTTLNSVSLTSNEVQELLENYNNLLLPGANTSPENTSLDT